MDIPNVLVIYVAGVVLFFAIIIAIGEYLIRYGINYYFKKKSSYDSMRAQSSFQNDSFHS